MTINIDNCNYCINSPYMNNSMLITTDKYECVHQHYNIHYQTIIVSYKRRILRTSYRITVLDHNKGYHLIIVISPTTVKTSPPSTALQKQHCLIQTDFYINIVPAPVVFQQQPAVSTTSSRH